MSANPSVFKNIAIQVDSPRLVPVSVQAPEETGGIVSDSLEMARFGHQHPAKTLVVAGVRFIGETAKILNPENVSSCRLSMLNVSWI